MAALWKKAVESSPAVEEASSSHLELKSALKKEDYKVKFYLNTKGLFRNDVKQKWSFHALLDPFSHF